MAAIEKNGPIVFPALLKLFQLPLEGCDAAINKATIDLEQKKKMDLFEAGDEYQLLYVIM